METEEQETLVKLDNPTRIPKARSQGYKAKNGFYSSKIPYWKRSNEEKATFRRKTSEKIWTEQQILFKEI